MTRYILLIATAALMYIQCGAQDMNSTLLKTFSAFDSTRDVTVKTAQANKLGLIAKKWKDEWAPHYYMAYAKAQMSFMMPQDEMEKKDALLDEADVELDEAVSILGKDNDETFILRAMLAQARMAVDGKNRWQKYGKLFDDNLRSAKELNEENPRIYYMKGTATYFTPKAFGGGAKNALSYFEKAQPLFEKEEKGNMNEPFWGSRANEYFIMQCKQTKDDAADGAAKEETDSKG
ncbi:MAG: hypothetical protein H6550_01950 [Chitinophagales bacterium]|nr:hypothetical protein [Chitinophagales bacterium]